MKKILRILVLVILFLLLAPMAVSADELSDNINLTDVFDQHGAVMMLIDPQTGDILYANNAAATFYGYAKQEMQSMKISDFNTLSEEETALEMQAAQNEERNYFVFKHRLAGGDVRTVEVYSYPVVYNEKSVLFSVVHDITQQTILAQQNERRNKIIFIAGGAGIFILTILIIIIALNRKNLKRSNHELKTLNEMRQSFLNANNTIMYLKDENFKYNFVNAAFLDAYNKKEEEIIGKDDYEISVNEFADMRRKSDLQALEKQDIVTDTIEWDDRIYESIKFPIKRMNGKIGIGAYVRNVTEEKNRQKQLQKMLVRHEILVEVLNRSFATTQEQLDYALHRALELTESTYGYIYFYDEQTEELTLNSWTRGVLDECAVAQPQTKYHLIHTGFWGEVVRQRKPILSNNFKADHPLKKGYPKGHVQLYNFMSIPVFVEEKIVAIVGMANKRGDYDDNDLFELTLLMAGIWNAVERREKQERLTYERNKYLQTIFSIGDGTIVVDSNGNIEMINSVAEQLTGWTLGEAKGRHYTQVFIFSHEMDGYEINDPVKEALQTGQVQELGNHAVLTARDGKKHYLEDSAAPIKNKNGDTEGVILVFRDVTDKREQRKKIEYLSFHDSLTGLYNRRYFEEELSRLDTQRNLPICVMMGDVNGLKLTNDIFGHTFGDMLLATVAKVLSKIFRSDDIIARWGGDEFVILLYQTNLEEAKSILSRLKEEFEKEQNLSIKMSIAMGVAVKTQVHENIWDVLSKAEEQMYANKSLDRDKFKNEVLNSIINLLHLTSPKDKEHAKNVSKICGEIGKALALSDTEMHKLKEAAYLHDIGKIALDSKLIKENINMNEEESRAFKNHPIVSYRILNSFENTMDLAEIVLAHHERWDGGGYPRGLKEKEILLAARILAVANCYEKKINNDQKPLSVDEAMEYMKENAGKCFDPKIVEALIKIIEGKPFDE
jgi:diguanylate cyclase (GGDEF)-like protein/PAS domain S-box-containing protein/putative nucleotidyltransferase with HDIG domain